MPEIKWLKARFEAGKSIDIVLKVVAIMMVLYQMVSTRIYLVDSYRHQDLHLAFAFVLVFLASMRAAKRRWQLLLALVFLLLSLVGTGYVFINMDYLLFFAGEPHPELDVLIIGCLLIFLLIEASRRSYGLVLPVVILAVFSYPFWGHLVPGFFNVAYYSADKIIGRTSIGSLHLVGIYGTILGISADVIFLFVVFGALLQATGAIRFFIQVGRFVSRKLAGGPALTSVVTSALVGMVTGSVSANIATTGSFTIPLMKRAGYSSEQAGAIEATASTGGQIMPPVMGAVAFVMMAMTGIAYIKLMAICAIPAILYFFSAGLYTQFQALKLNLKAGFATEEVDYREMLVNAPLFIIPLLFLITFLIMGVSLGFTMALTILLLVALSLIRKETRPSLSQWVSNITQGAITASQIAVMCGSLGVIVASIGLTGMSLKIPYFIVGFSGGNLIIALVLTMIASIILGMGVATITSYILVALIATPALIKMGVTLPQAHLFSFYFACMAMLTPPVAIGAIIAAKLAGARFFPTAIESCKVAVAGFVLPYLMIWCPVLILDPGGPLWAVVGLIASIILLVALQVVICSHYLTTVSPWERAIFAMSALLIFFSLPGQNVTMAGAGLIVFVLASIWQWRKRKILAEQPVEAAG
ncbi:TRAP transporter permease [Chloroflexota bacterium]